MPAAYRNDHDLSLPQWGPYAKDYYGVSHLTCPAQGLRFDVCVVPGRFRGEFFPPDAIRPSGWLPWDAAPALSRYSYRQQIVWKDEVYAQVEIRPQGGGAVLEVELVNHTDKTECLCLHLCASLSSPTLPGTREPLRSVRPLLPDNASWLRGIDYASLDMQPQSAHRGLNYDAVISGETCGHSFSGGYGLGRGFGSSPADCVRYAVPAGAREVLLRWRAQGGTPAIVRVQGATVPPCAAVAAAAAAVTENNGGQCARGQHAGEQRTSGQDAEYAGALLSVAGGEFSTQVLAIPSGQREIAITCENGEALQIDGLAFGEKGFAQGVRFEPLSALLTPELLRDAEHPRSADLRYPEHGYRISWDQDGGWVRQYRCNDVSYGVLRSLHDHVRDVIDLGEQGHITDVFFGPIDVAPRSGHKLSFRLEQLATTATATAATTVHGTAVAAAVSRTAATHTAATAAVSAANTSTAAAATTATTATALAKCHNPAEPHVRFGRDRLAAVTLTNVVFPIRAKGGWIRHFTPGRWWDSLYTWDSGCIGLGLASIDLPRSVDNLLAYLCEPGDAQAAFVHHGSMVPTQFYQAQDIWNRSQDTALLEHLWPRLEQYYRYFTGQAEGSAMRPFDSGLLVPWDYFYNSGGWDDYPPQHHLASRQQQRASVSPCITNASAIRIAKTMAGFANILGKDASAFHADAAQLTAALQQHGWDAQSGFFGYVIHNTQGQPAEFLRDESGHFFNRGMDGLSPLIAGATSAEQAAQLWQTLLDPQRFFTPIGLAAVDMQAPYYDKGGYWNGSVWMPYQWFFWKAMLDYGLAAEAHELAKRVLGIYGSETLARHYCWEHFMVESERGAGWHHFSGLSAPVLNLYESYYTASTISGGHDFFLLEQDWSSDFTACTFTASYGSGSDVSSGSGSACASGNAAPAVRSLLITVPAGQCYQVSIDGQSVPHSSPVDGCLSINHAFGEQPFRVSVQPLG